MELYDFVLNQYSQDIEMINKNSKGKMIGVIIIAIVLAIAQSNLSVYNLESLGVKNQALKNIQYSVANFGFAPLGKTIIGKLVLSPKFSSQCTLQHDNRTYQNSFMLIPRGQCQFVVKTLNAQSLGAQMVIIMDEQKHQNKLIMADNGYGYKVKIPSIFINHQDGELLKEILEDNPDSSVMLKMIFENKKTAKVNVNFYVQSNNRQSSRLVQNFRKFYPLIKEHINFKLVYSAIGCESKCKEEDCYHNKDYCALNLIHEEGANGQLILDQQITEQIVFDQQPEKWWNYMKYLSDECATVSQLKECGKAGMKKQGINWQKVEKTFGESFTTTKDNNYLKQNKEDLSMQGINKYPTVTLNGQKVKGSLNGQYIFDDICNTLEKPPQECQKYVNFESFQYRFSNQFPTLILVILIGVIIFSIIFVLYRRYMKRRISSDMQGRVDDMVSKYIQFYSERSRNK